MIQRWLFQRWSFGLCALAAACGGSAGSGTNQVQPARSAAGAVQSFMRAVADSNLAQMATLWGTSQGPAASTRQPTDYERRIVVIQSYLRHDDYRVAADAAAGEDRRDVRVELRRQACTWTVPFTVLKLGDGSWIVNQVDLVQAAGNPARPCDPNASGADPGNFGLQSLSFSSVSSNRIPAVAFWCTKVMVSGPIQPRAVAAR